MTLNFKKNYKIELADTLGQNHWYSVYEIKKNKKEKFLGYFPSSTTVLQAYPFSQQLVRWIAEQGYEESKKIRDEAGVHGTRVHQGIETLLSGATLSRESYSTEEWNALSAFVAWHCEYHPEILATEIAVYSKLYAFAGRADVVCKISGKIMVGDWKTSKTIHPNFPLQVASYAYALEEQTDLKVEETFVLQLGAKNKNNYRFVIYPEWRDHFKTFLDVFRVWKYDNGITKDFKPPVLALPATLKL